MSADAEEGGYDELTTTDVDGQIGKQVAAVRMRAMGLIVD